MSGCDQGRRYGNVTANHGSLASGSILQVNQQVADRLREAADILELQGANPFRVNAYRRAAATIAGLAGDMEALYHESGRDGLEALPGIGRGIATAIEEMIRSGRWSQLERMRGELDPEKLLQAVPGIGPGLARRIHDSLHVDTLQALEVAAHDGRLQQVPGLGPRRAMAIAASLNVMLGHTRAPRAQTDGPAVADLLAVDEDYRERASRKDLPMIAPKRFNPSGEAWLPILHTEHDGWHYTALFSNTARAHELKKTWDWVVLYFYDDHHQEGQHTVVTESRGPLAGKRVVRGRENECRSHYGVAA